MTTDKLMILGVIFNSLIAVGATHLGLPEVLNAWFALGNLIIMGIISLHPSEGAVAKLEKKI